MKLFFHFALFLVSSCAGGKELVYTGSTPVGETVRQFFGISLTDSIDFMRWKLTFHNSEYNLTGNYGIGKANTNGFVDGGKKIALQGRLEKRKHQYLLENKGKTLRLAVWNNNLLHLLDEAGILLVGGAGWSYTLSLIHPTTSDVMNVHAKHSVLKDSAVFQGRTPCLEFANAQSNAPCYKLKWWLVLYADPKTGKPAGYYLKGTVVDHKGKKGQWVIATGKNGRIVYQLNSDDGDSLYLLQVDENILVFTDKAGNLLTGNADFSYTLNRKR